MDNLFLFLDNLFPLWIIFPFVDFLFSISIVFKISMLYNILMLLVIFLYFCAVVKNLEMFFKKLDNLFPVLDNIFPCWIIFLLPFFSFGQTTAEDRKSVV